MDDEKLIELFLTGRPKGEGDLLEIRMASVHVSALVDESECVWSVRYRSNNPITVGVSFWIGALYDNEDLFREMEDDVDFWYDGEVHWEDVDGTEQVEWLTHDASATIEPRNFDVL